MTGAAFLAYVEQFLAPTLAKGEVVVLDHLAPHKVAGVRQAIQVAGASLLYLRPYSSDLNPIEQASPSSRHCSGKPRLAPERPSGPPSGSCSTPSPQPSAATTLPTQATRSSKPEVF